MSQLATTQQPLDLPGVTTTETGISIPEDISYEDWLRGLTSLKWLGDNLPVALSHYIKFGERKWGHEKTSTALAQLEFDLPDITTAMNIASVPEDVRKPNLDSAHYVVLAKSGLKKAQIAKWAQTASEQNLTPSRLKASIAAGAVVSKDVANQQLHGVVTIQGIRGEFELWLRKVGGVAGIVEMGEDAASDVLEELRLFRDTHETLGRRLNK